MVISHKYKFIFIKTTKVGGTSLELMLNSIKNKDDVFTPHWEKENSFIPQNNFGLFNPLPEMIQRIKNTKSLIKNGGAHTWNNFLKREKYFENIPAWQLKCRVPRSIWNEYYKFSIERNPWDKCVSRYYQSKSIFEKKYNKELTFKMWFDYFVNRLEKPWITSCWASEAPYNFPRYANPWTDEILVDKIIRYENLEEELSEMFEHLGMQFNGLSDFHAKSNYRKDRKHYSEIIPSEYVSEIANVFKKEIELMNYKF